MGGTYTYLGNIREREGDKGAGQLPEFLHHHRVQHLVGEAQVPIFAQQRGVFLNQRSDVLSLPCTGWVGGWVGR